MKDELKNALLYGIVDRGYVQQTEIRVVAESLIAGGADIIQLRAKSCDEVEIESMARELLPLCRAAGVPFIVNDFPEIAARVGADGVHIGQDVGS